MARREDEQKDPASKFYRHQHPDASLSLDEHQAVHAVRLYLDAEEVLRVAFDREKALHDAWHRFVPAHDATARDKIVKRDEAIGDAWNAWHLFRDAWVVGKGTLADLNRQIDAYNGLKGVEHKLERVGAVTLSSRLAELEQRLAAPATSPSSPVELSGLAEFERRLAALEASKGELADLAARVARLERELPGDPMGGAPGRGRP